MLIPFGVFSAAGAGGGAAGAYELISTTVLGANAANITFNTTGLGSTYKHLQLRIAGRSNRSDNVDTLSIRFNGSSSSYAWHRLYGQGSSVASDVGTDASEIRAGLIASQNVSSGIFSGVIVDILDPFTGSKNTTTRSFIGSHTGSVNYVQLASGMWNSVSPITSIVLATVSANNLYAGTRASLYGIKG